MLNYDRWHEIDANRKLSKDPYQFWPKLDTKALDASGDFYRRDMVNVVEAAQVLVNKLKAKRDELMKSKRYSDQGRRDALREFYNEEIATDLRGLRQDMVAPAKQSAIKQAVKAAASMPQPQTPLEIAVAQESWRLVREGNLGYQDVVEMSPQVRQAVALAPPELSGMSAPSHALVRRAFLDEHANGQLSEAEELGATVDVVEDLLDHAEQAAQAMVGIEPDSPHKVEDPLKKEREMAEAAASVVAEGQVVAGTN